jgi:hypothetical protein
MLQSSLRLAVPGKGKMGALRLFAKVLSAFHHVTSLLHENAARGNHMLAASPISSCFMFSSESAGMNSETLIHSLRHKACH